MTTPKRAPTIKDIALAVGVSTATVSQALRPNPGSNIKLPAETVRRVQATARKMNYRVHSGARSIRSKVFYNIGFFTAKEGKAHSPDGLLAGLHDMAEEAGYRITHLRLPKEMERIQEWVPHMLNERGLDALVIGSYHPISTYIHDRLKDDNLPVIYLNDRHPHNAIYVDDRWGGESMTRHLIERGYRRILFVMRSSPDNPPLESMHHSAKERLEGYRAVMNAAGLEPRDVTLFADEVVGGPYRFPPEWPALLQDADALMAYDDDLANQLGRHLYAQRKFIPDDIALTGYNGDYGSLSAWKALTTMQIPFYEMGKASFAMARALAKSGNAKPAPSIAVRPVLVRGDTTR